MEFDIKNLINTYADKLLESIAIIIITFLFLYFLKRFTKRMSKRIYGDISIYRIVFRGIRLFILAISGLLLFNTWGLTLSPILASLGVVGVALSLGAQKVIQDLLAGVFIHAEHQFKINDVIEVKGFKGRVIYLGPRITRLQNWKGEIMIIANGQIEQLVNYSTSYATAEVDFPVSFGVEYHHIEEIINDFFKNYQSDNILEKPELAGVNDFNEYCYFIKVFCKVKPGTQFQIQRDIKTGLKDLLEQHGIKMPKSKLGL